MISIHQPHLTHALACMPSEKVCCILKSICLACMCPWQWAGIAFPSM